MRLVHDPASPVLVGVVHLAPLPGSPRGHLTIEEIIDVAVRDAVAYQDGGAHAVIIENFGDVPFLKDQVEPHTVAAMTLAIREVRSVVSIPAGINVLRNDALAAVGVAALTGAPFIRVNVHTGVTVADQGIIEGRADRTLRYRKQLGADVAIWADILVKHGVPLGSQMIEDAASDAVHRGLADAVIVTGQATGKAPDPADLARVRAVLPTTPVYVGSGVTPETVASYFPAASGIIVGTWAKVDGRIENRVDRERVRLLAGSMRAAAGKMT
ncbi:BtpA/SgcQ family protein [Nitrolancea hollandica]|uniref:BtpA/SgcQ family protein n=1 Tax=Nitrolancea hollandica TaxID=1206749 RepID=UPI001EE669EF|nr:BtpA/SgcQ family protein [Nitrolancea hollandica]